MRAFASTILLFFVLFLAAPAIVAYLEKDKDKAELCENCNNSSSAIEEIKHDIKYYTYNPLLEMIFLDSAEGSGRIIFENLSRHDLICAAIFIPPPNLV